MNNQAAGVRLEREIKERHSGGGVHHHTRQQEVTHTLPTHAASTLASFSYPASLSRLADGMSGEDPDSCHGGTQPASPLATPVGPAGRQRQAARIWRTPHPPADGGHTPVVLLSEN